LARDPQTPVQVTDTPDFERALGELENLVERLERGDLPLEEALRIFERGVELTRHCQTSLKAAQQKVEILLKRSGQTGIEAFGVPEDDTTSAGPE
jgi:exodeoxyribonuclease VII small subunit